MKKTLFFAYFALICAATAQTLEFETASVKVIETNTTQMSGGPGTSSPGKFTGTGSLKAFVKKAWDVTDQEIVGPTTSPIIYYSITANVPAGTSEPNFRLMLQDLLAKRLGIMVHKEVREQKVLKLVVGKQGVKFQRHIPLPEDVNENEDKSSSPHSMGLKTEPSKIPGQIRFVGTNKEIKSLAAFLEFMLRQRVVDETGLVGRYDFAFEFNPKTAMPGQNPSGSDASTGRTLTDAVSDMGLKLETAKESVRLLIIDKFRPVPSPN